MAGKRILVATAAALLTIGLSACGNGASSLSGSVPIPSAPQRMTPIDTPPAPAPEQQDTPAPDGDAPPEVEAPGQPPSTSEPGSTSPEPDTTCQVDELKLSLTYQGSGAGSQYQALVFTNGGERSCVVRGFPGVSYVAAGDAHQVGKAAFREGSKGPAVLVAPGQQASAMLKLTNVDNYDAATCVPTEARGLRVYPPHTYDSVVVPMTDAEGCASEEIPGEQLTVRTVEPGAPTGP